MALDLKYFRNHWDGTWKVENTITHQSIEIVGKCKIRTEPFELAPGQTGTTFSFRGTDPRQKKWVDFHRMFSLVKMEDKQYLVIKWEDGSGIPEEDLPFSAEGGKVLLTLDTQMSGVLGIIVQDGNFGEIDTAWGSYYNKFPAPGN